MPDPSPTTLTV